MMWTSPLLQVHGECNVHIQLAETITAGPNCLTSPNLHRDNHFTKMILLYKSVNNSNNATTTYIYIYAVYQKSQIKIALYVFITFSPNTCITWCIKFPLFPDITYHVYENSQYMSVNISSDSTKYRTKVLYSSNVQWRQLQYYVTKVITDDFSIIIQMQQNFYFTLIRIQINWLS